VQFLTSLFGGSGNTVLTAFFALGIVLVLIVLAVWLLKLVFNASGNVSRGRNRRLSVVDTLSLDPRRQLIIVRRDNVEHLILTGGAQDLVVETGIPVQEVPQTQPVRRPLPGAARAMRPPLKPKAEPTPEVLPVATIEPLRQPSSLRHTGLMRPVDRSEAGNPDKSAHPAHDSAKEVTARQEGRTTELGDQFGDTHRDDRKADGR